MSPITNCMKKGEFMWTKVATKAFAEITNIMTQKQFLWLPNFLKAFEVAYVEYRLGIGGAWVNKGIPLLILMRILMNKNKKYSPYDKEFFVIMRA